VKNLVALGNGHAGVVTSVGWQPDEIDERQCGNRSQSRRRNSRLDPSVGGVGNFNCDARLTQLFEPIVAEGWHQNVNLHVAVVRQSQLPRGHRVLH
jgi:hypothetical protein